MFEAPEEALTGGDTAGSDKNSVNRLAAPIQDSRGLRSADAIANGTDQTQTRRAFLNPRNTFENFVVGSGNQLSHAASMAVANAPGRAYNPLFVYGETGFGKTHLMHAVAHQMLANNPNVRKIGRAHV